jgi:DNA primase
MERIDFPEALKRLAEQAHVQLPDRADAKPSLKNRLYEVNEAAEAFFSACLRSDGGVRARAYLEKRQFGPEAIDLFALGYAPAGREVMATALRAKGFDDRILLAAGLVYPEENGGKLRDRFRARLIFPIRDASGKVVGFGGRTLGDEQPKYLNSPQTEIFDKSSVLFGIHRAAAGIREAKRAVLVEGYLDAIRAHLGAYSNTVASLGTSVTVPQLSALSRLTDTVILALDPDLAGQAAAARTAITALAELTRSRGRHAGDAGTVELRIATLPDGTGDPDELIRDHPQRWEAALDASVPAFEFFFDTTVRSLDKNSERWKQEAIDRLLPLYSSSRPRPAGKRPGSSGWHARQVWTLASFSALFPAELLPNGASCRAPETSRTRL